MDAVAQPPPSFDERFVALASLSYRVAFRLVGDRVEAEDLAQEALARAYASWRKVATYDEAWVVRVTTNLAISRWRKHGRVVSAEAGDRSTDGTGGRSAEAHGRRWAREPAAPDPLDRLELVAALRSLPRRQREVVALRYLADLSESEVAASLGCATGTVKQHAHRGLATLRRHLGHLGASGEATHTDEEKPGVRAAR
jgi:RNA polymerase sigma factor (sigma-70 family)